MDFSQKKKNELQNNADYIYSWNQKNSLLKYNDHPVTRYLNFKKVMI